MPGLPTGTVTFLFTDIVGSTVLWERHRGVMAAALARHDAVLRGAIEAHGGHVFKTVGDQFCAVFASIPEALAAALAAQRALTAEAWEVPGGLRARMALHTGGAEERGGDYFGPTLNRTARILAAGHGGQILLSHATRELALDQLPQGIRLRDLGQFRLKDLARPEHLFQLLAPALPADFPPLRTLDSRPNNLPVQPTPLVGYERELEAARELLLRPNVRLVSLTGPPESGKTRLALQAAAELLENFESGVFFVPLGGLRDPGFVATTIARTLGFEESAGRLPLESLKAHLRQKRMLLVLDAFDPVRPAGPVVTELLEAAPGLKALVTSQAALNVGGEHELRVSAPRRTRLTRRRVAISGGVALALLLGFMGLYLARSERTSGVLLEQAVAGTPPALAVLPFTVRGSELEIWKEGMVDVLSTNLAGVPGLRTIDSQTVLARWREAIEGPEAPDLETALEAARRADARWALVGNVLAIGPDVRLDATIYDVERGTLLRTTQAVEGPADSLLALVDRLSIEVLQTILQSQITDLRQVNLGRVTTHSLPALKAYLEGEVLLRRSEFEQAIPAYQRAVDADSTFALAFYRLATAYGWTEIIESDADRRYMERAARLSGRLTDRDALLVRAKLAFWRGSLDGLEPLRQEVRRHPDDAEAWYLLGETSFHLGRQDLAGQDENDRAFARAVQLDSSFTPAYVHLIENAFNYHADSARAARLVEAYGRLAPGSESSRLNRLALDLAFGDPSARKAAGAALDSLSARSLMGIALHLWHPRFGPAQEEVLVAARDRGGPEATDATVLLFLNGFLRGRLQAALALLDDPLMPGGYREAGFYVPYIARLGALLDQPVISSDRLDRELVLTEVDSFPYLDTFYSGAYAADRERWTEHARATRRLQEGAAHLLSKGDSTKARFTNGLALALEGYSLAKRDRGEEAVRLLEAAQRQATAWAPLEVANATIRFWLSKLSQEAGEMREAEPYAGSFWQDPLASFSLGQVYENLEKYDKARDAYEFFTAGWRDADSDLQPLVEEGRRAAARLPR